MLQSRKDDYDEHDEELVEEAVVAGGTGDPNKNLTLAERRALAKARRQESRQGASATTASDDDDDADDDGEPSGSALTPKKGTRTRSRDEAEALRQRQAQGRAENMPVVGGLAAYFRGVWAEIQKVTWPTQEEAWRLTRIVSIVTVIFALVLGAVDLLYGRWFSASIADNANFIIGLVPFLIAASALSYVVFIQSAE